jgi:hypothetical protein
MTFCHDQDLNMDITDTAQHTTPFTLTATGDTFRACSLSARSVSLEIRNH